MFQTPFADRIRNEGRLTTMAVGNIYEPDHVNSILAAGRADLVALARPHLIDPIGRCVPRRSSAIAGVACAAALSRAAWRPARPHAGSARRSCKA